MKTNFAFPVKPVKLRFRFFSILCIVISILGCKPEDPPKPYQDPDPVIPSPSAPGGDSNDNGSISFWAKTDLGVGNIKIYIENAFVGTLNVYHSQGITCGKGGLIITKQAGTYAWNAVSADGTVTWEGVITIPQGGCFAQQLLYTPPLNNPGTSNPSQPAPPPIVTPPNQHFPAPGPGKVTFWTKRSEGQIQVYMNVKEGINLNESHVGLTGTITKYYTGSPDCAASGCVTAERPNGGYYNFTAGNGKRSWKGSVYINPGECLLMELE